MSCYLKQVEQNLPRILAMYDRDRTSDSYGCGDRFYWGWKLIDFPNSTFQALASGLAGLCAKNSLPEFITEEATIELIHSIFQATEKQLSRQGGLDEAFPNEASFCVTGLVAGDLLLAMERLDNKIDIGTRNKWITIIRPMITFLHKQDEYHGIISNHLATNALALIRWTDLTGENVDSRAKEWTGRILKHQSEEGWFREYDGADPGYQTWCTSSLAAIHELRPDWGLKKSLEKSLEFLVYAAHPDGSFGGIYGSRMTRFIFPAGLEKLSAEFPKAKLLAEFARNSIEDKACVTLDTIDPSNCIPVFNDYVTASLEYAESNQVKSHGNGKLPCNVENFTRVFKDAGWLIHKEDKSYTILNLYCGAAGVRVSVERGYKQISGYVGKNDRGVIYTTQIHDRTATWDVQKGNIILKSNLYPVKRPKPDAFRFMVLRALSITAFKSIFLGNVVKKLLVKMLVTGKETPRGKLVRKIQLDDECKVDDDTPPHLENITDPSFKPVHMASFGYWQRSDTCLKVKK